MVIMAAGAIILDFDINEKLAGFVGKHESWELDEIVFFVPIALIVCLSFYGRQRLRELARTARAVKESESRYRSLVDSTEDSIYVVNRDSEYIFMNKKHMARLGMNEEEYVGHPYGEYHSPEEKRIFSERVEQTFKTGVSSQYEYRSPRDGKYFLQTFSPVMGKGNSTAAITIVSKEITARKQMEEQLRSMSLTDELTGLYNRRGFMTLAGQYLRIANRQKKVVFMLYADLDNLKLINDKFGHSEGDYAIVEIANLLKEGYRESDIVARIGGDEFAVLPAGYEGDSVDAIASRLKEKLDLHNVNSSRIFKLSLSAGIVFYDPDSPCSLEELIQKADTLMYEQKRTKLDS